MFKRTLALAIFTSATVAMPASASAATVVLDFAQGNYCRGGQLCTNNGSIDDSYGDTSLVDVTLRSIDAGKSTAAYYYERGYGNLEGVVYAGPLGSATSRGLLTIFAAAGYELSLGSFDMACFASLPNCRIGNYKVTTLTQEIAGFANLEAAGYYTNVIDTAYSRALTLEWGNGENVGLDNIRFDVRAISTAPAVPEPATWAMMIAGFGMIGSVLRRRGKQNTAFA